MYNSTHTYHVSSLVLALSRERLSDGGHLDLTKGVRIDGLSEAGTSTCEGLRVVCASGRIHDLTGVILIDRLCRDSVRRIGLAIQVGVVVRILKSICAKKRGIGTIGVSLQRGIVASIRTASRLA